MKKEKKNHIINWIALILFVIVMVASVVDIMRKHNIIEKIVANQKDVISQNNYSYHVESYNKNNESETTKSSMSFYKKDKISMQILKNNDNSLIFWYDLGANEQITLVPQNLKASVYKNSSEFFVNQLPPYMIDEENKNIMKIFSIITSDTVNGEKCYKINTSGLITWYSKESGMILKAQNGKKVIDGKEYDCISEFKDWKFNELTDEDVTRPNLTGYEVTNNE